MYIHVLEAGSSIHCIILGSITTVECREGILVVVLRTIKSLNCQTTVINYKLKNREGYTLQWNNLLQQNYTAFSNSLLKEIVFNTAVLKCKWCKSMRKLENSVVKVSLRETLDTLGLSRNFFSTQSFHIISFQSENRKLEGRNPYKD